MSATSKSKNQLAGTMFENTVKCTAIHPTPKDKSRINYFIDTECDLVLVSDTNEFFLLRAAPGAYQCQVQQTLNTAWRYEVQWSIQNCHGIQLIMIDE